MAETGTSTASFRKLPIPKEWDANARSAERKAKEINQVLTERIIDPLNLEWGKRYNQVGIFRSWEDLRHQVEVDGLVFQIKAHVSNPVYKPVFEAMLTRLEDVIVYDDEISGFQRLNSDEGPDWFWESENLERFLGRRFRAANEAKTSYRAELKGPTGRKVSSYDFTLDPRRLEGNAELYVRATEFVDNAKRVLNAVDLLRKANLPSPIETGKGVKKTKVKDAKGKERELKHGRVVKVNWARYADEIWGRERTRGKLKKQQGIFPLLRGGALDHDRLKPYDLLVLEGKPWIASRSLLRRMEKVTEYSVHQRFYGERPAQPY